jgi:hypothetical protein
MVLFGNRVFWLTHYSQVVLRFQDVSLLGCLNGIYLMLQLGSLELVLNMKVDLWCLALAERIIVVEEWSHR